MKIIGGFLIFLALYGFQEAVTLSNVLWLIFGLFFIAVEQWVMLFNYVYKSIR